MKRFVLPLVVLVGVCLVLTGFWWTWTGFDIVQVERGWSSVIAGATMLSAGFIVLALAALLDKLAEIAAVLRDEPQHRAIPSKRERAREASSEESRPDAPQTRGPPPAKAAAAPANAAATPANAASDDRAAHEGPGALPVREIVGTHRSGDAIYTMYSDGSVEAETADGTLSFASLDDLRAYADERAMVEAR